MITYGNTITPEAYMYLRNRVGWCEFPLEEAEAGIKHSYALFVAYDGERTIGVLRLLWDHGYIAYLSDVIIDPDYQRKGIGSELLKQCLQRIKDDMKPGYKVKFFLMAAKGKEPFYTRFGFRERPNEVGGAGMDQWIILE